MLVHVGSHLSLLLIQGLPKTSYYKLIDWWLFAGLNKLVLIFAVHTYLAYVVSQEKSMDSMDRHELKRAKKVNNFFKIASAISFTLFMIIFWSIALIHYNKPVEDYIQ